MPCSICAHPEVVAIAAALSRGDSLRQIGAAYQVDKSTLARHKNTCLTPVSVAPQAGNTAPTIGQPTARAYLINPAIHAALTQLYATMPTDQKYLNDPRQAVAEVVALLLQVVKDETPPDPSGDRDTFATVVKSSQRLARV